MKDEFFVSSISSELSYADAVIEIPGCRSDEWLGKIGDLFF
jgi:hypothetical protein